MPLILDGTLGITTPAESVTGTDVWSVGGSQIYKDAAGNVGIGTSTPSTKLEVSAASSNATLNQEVMRVSTTGRSASGGTANRSALIAFSDSANATLTGAVGGFRKNSNVDFAGGLKFLYNGASASSGVSTLTEGMTLDSSGNLLVGTTSTGNLNKIGIVNTGQIDYGIAIKNSNALLDDAIAFINNSNTRVGVIQFTTTATTYATSSDYRLKNTIAPMTGALNKVALLKPVTYKWIVDGSDGQGFIAHELAEVEPGCVSGEKDAVDAEGKPKYQGIDTSFLVATLAAAIQELKAIIDTQATRITALEAK